MCIIPNMSYFLNKYKKLLISFVSIFFTWILGLLYNIIPLIIKYLCCRIVEKQCTNVLTCVVNKHADTRSLKLIFEIEEEHDYIRCSASN